MREYYEINRSKDCHKDYVNFADEYLIKAFRVYKGFFFISKKKRLEAIKRLAQDQLMDVNSNLTQSNWVCLSKSAKKLDIVRGFIMGSVATINHLTEIKLK
jgi:hypothetical protein